MLGARGNLGATVTVIASRRAGAVVAILTAVVLAGASTALLACAIVLLPQPQSR